ncbi:MAG: PIN domain-containing protein [Actinobacteria bacterium]|nr:PIN domain-containing protein [Actinomycetota bacterium]
MPFYLDTSAALKLIVAEEHSGAVRRWYRRHALDVISSDLLRIEALRAARRLGPAVARGVRALLDATPLLTLGTTVCETAAALDPAIVRSLDALHLAAALAVGDALDGIVTYDERLAGAAALHAVAVVTPR